VKKTKNLIDLLCSCINNVKVDKERVTDFTDIKNKCMTGAIVNSFDDGLYELLGIVLTLGLYVPALIAMNTVSRGASLEGLWDELFPYYDNLLDDKKIEVIKA